MKNSASTKHSLKLLFGIMLTVSLISIFLMSMAGTRAIYAASATVTRTLPAAVNPGQTFNVTVTFTAPSNDLNAVGLSDFVPVGWTITANNSWNTPNSNTSNVTSNRVDYIWNGPFAYGTSFTVVYQLTAPVDAAAGTYLFTHSSPAPRLEYYIAGTGPFSDNITGQNAVNIGLASSTTLLTSSLNSSLSGQLVTFTAMVSALTPSTAVPTGIVTFKDGNVALGVDALDASGQAYLISALSSGNHILSASYSGDANFTPSTSVDLSQTVNQSSEGGGGGGSPLPSISLSGFQIPSLIVNYSGVLQSAVRLQTPDQKLTLDITPGTILLNSSNAVLGSLSVTPLTSPPPALEGYAIVMSYSFTPDGAQFNPALTLTLAYGLVQSPSNIAGNDLIIAWFDGQQWQKLGTVIDPSAGIATAKVTHFSDFALLAKAILPQNTNTLTPIPAKTSDPPAAVQPATAPPAIIPPASISPAAILPPAASVPAPVSSPAIPASSIVPLKPSGPSWGVIGGIIAGVLLVLIIIAIVVNKRRTR